MSREIGCMDCGISLGEIRDATLRKNTAHLCNVCAGTHSSMKTQIQLFVAQTISGKKNPDYMDAFKDIFGDIFGKR